jgi:hypothetical protein
MEQFSLAARYLKVSVVLAIEESHLPPKMSSFSESILS